MGAGGGLGGAGEFAGAGVGWGSNIGMRFLLSDITLLQGNHKAAMKEYLKGTPNSPTHWYQAALIAFREEDYVAASTYLRRGIAANPSIAEGVTGRTVLSEHLAGYLTLFIAITPVQFRP